MKTSGVVTVFALLPVCSVAQAQLHSLDLLSALDEGHVRAVFYGNGDTSVRGYVERDPLGPAQVTIEPGTQFYAQLGGRQGMGALGRHDVDLSGPWFAYVEIPTVCTNLGLRAPTNRDLMIAGPSPDWRMVGLLSLAALTEAPQHAFQIGAWAIADDPPAESVRQLARLWVKPCPERGRSEGAQSDELSADEVEAKVDALFAQAQSLLTAAGCDPTQFRMFRAEGQ